MWQGAQSLPTYCYSEVGAIQTFTLMRQQVGMNEYCTTSCSGCIAMLFIDAFKE